MSNKEESGESGDKGKGTLWEHSTYVWEGEGGKWKYRRIRVSPSVKTLLQINPIDCLKSFKLKLSRFQ